MYEGNIKNMECPNCKKSNKINSTTDNNYFVTYQLESLLKEVILENIEDFIVTREKTNDNITDISDGKLYNETQVINKVHKVTLTLNTDGVQVFKSKNKSLWPIQLIVNELPIKKRFQTKNILVSGLWYDTTHPPMELFLKPIIYEGTHLIEIKWIGIKI